MTAEAEVLAAEGAVRVDDVREVVGDATVESDLMTRVASQVMAEATKAAVELLKDNGLSLDFTDLLGDDPNNGC